jgi:hypothetical protein
LIAGAAALLIFSVRSGFCHRRPRSAGQRRRGRLAAQSIAWIYAPGREPHGQDDSLDVHAAGTRGVTADGVAMLERLTIASPPIDGVALRYGHLYGPGTGAAAAEIASLHVDATALAALLAIEKAGRGIYNIAEPSRYLSTEKARRELGFRLTASLA